MFRLESSLEFMDRYANFISQAKKEAKLQKTTVENILKRADDDKALFNKLNTEVNKSLGDYIGRNYAIPTEAYNLLGEAIPFYRFLTQTGRTTLHQMAHNPLALAGNVTIPSRVGGKIYDNILRQYNLDPEEYKGGVPYAEQNGNIRTLSFEPLPIAAVAGQVGNWMQGKDLTSGINPAFSSLPDALRFKVMDRQATTPRLTQLMLTNPREAKNFKPTLGEQLSLIGNQFLANTYNPYIWATRLYPELKETIRPTGGLQSRYNTNPFKVNPLGYNRDYPMELAGKWVGLQTSSNYPKAKQSKSSSKKNMMQAGRNRKRMENAKKNKRGI